MIYVNPKHVKKKGLTFADSKGSWRDSKERKVYLLMIGKRYGGERRIISV